MKVFAVVDPGGVWRGQRRGTLRSRKPPMTRPWRNCSIIAATTADRERRDPTVSAVPSRPRLIALHCTTYRRKRFFSARG
jgi:hypothetical protein